MSIRRLRGVCAMILFEAVPVGFIPSRVLCIAMADAERASSEVENVAKVQRHAARATRSRVRIHLTKLDG